MKWQPIKTAPKDGTVILFGFTLPCGTMREEDRRVYEGRWSDIQRKFTSVNGVIVLDQASHWMPMPTPPQADTGTEHGDV